MNPAYLKNSKNTQKLEKYNTHIQISHEYKKM